MSNGSTLGRIVMGVKAPIVQEGDDIVDIVVGSLKNSIDAGEYKPKERDVIGITESTVARSQGNYVTIDDIANEIREKYSGGACGGHVGVMFPILSRNRFSLILKGIARASDVVFLQLSYPGDEVGNPLMDVDMMDQNDINPNKDILYEIKYREIFGEAAKHPFTGVDYVAFYNEIIASQDAVPNIFLSNQMNSLLSLTSNILTADIHTRKRTKHILRKFGSHLNVYGLDDICSTPVEGRGYNEEYGLLGSNMATDERLKLFPRDCDKYVREIQKRMKELTGKNIEVMVYGDGAFKDPVGKIWELADPVVSPGYTDGLKGTPNEIKMKYFADNQLKGLTREEAEEAMKEHIRKKDNNLVGKMASQGTTPRQLTDLLGSLFDLTSGSGDQGTPIVVVQNYFNNYAT